MYDIDGKNRFTSLEIKYLQISNMIYLLIYKTSHIYNNLLLNVIQSNLGRLAWKTMLRYYVQCNKVDLAENILALEK